MGNGFKKLKTAYELAKNAKVGDGVYCPSCGSKFIKTNYQSAFCKTKDGTICKDKYWNTVTPTKRNNKTRISPASARNSRLWNMNNDAYEDVFTHRHDQDRDYDDDPSWDAHKDSC